MATIKARFKGIADVREISVKDLQAGGVNTEKLGIDKDLVWHAGNLFVVELPADEQLEDLLRAQGHFTVSKVKDDGTEETEADATDTQNPGDVIVDGTTGASTPAAKTPSKR